MFTLKYVHLALLLHVGEERQPLEELNPDVVINMLSSDKVCCFLGGSHQPKRKWEQEGASSSYIDLNSIVLSD